MQLARDVIRGLGRSAIHACHRFSVHGLEHVPDGPALLLSNHVSFVDWLYLGAALPETPRFVMHQHHWHMRRYRWFFDLYDVIPIAPGNEDRARLRDGLRRIEAALERGDKVLLFPEGTMTPDGRLSPLRPGFTRILRRCPVPVVPIGTRGLWGSWLSRAGGEPGQGWPSLHRSSVEVHVGEPMRPEEATLEAVTARLVTLSGQLSSARYRASHVGATEATVSFASAVTAAPSSASP